MSTNPIHEYPTLSLAAAWNLLGNRTVADLKGEYESGELGLVLEKASTVKKVPAWTGDDPFIFDKVLSNDLASVAQSVVASVRESAQKKGNRTWDEEQRASAHFYQLLENKKLPVVVQEDSEFWLYLTCVLLLPILLEHEPIFKAGPREGRLAGKHLGTPKQGDTADSDTDAEAVVREQRSNDILAKRMYLRGRIAAVNPEKNPAPPVAIANASEAESSHILTGRTVRQHAYAEKLVAHICNNQALLTQDELRRVVKNVLNVKKATKVVEVLSDEGLEEIFKNSGL